MRTQPVTPKLRNAVATAMVGDLIERGIPANVPQRQTMVTQAVARSLGMRFADVSPVVKEHWSKVYGR